MYIDVIKEALFQSGGVINWVIIIAFAYTLARLSIVTNGMKNILRRINDVYREVSNEVGINARSGAVGNYRYVEIDNRAVDSARDDFNKAGSSYISYTQLIPVFPLLGLFGTICGLLPGLSQMTTNDMTGLYGSLSVALVSTFFGLIASIILKLYIALKSSRIINDIECQLVEIDRKYENLLNNNKIFQQNMGRNE